MLEVDAATGTLTIPIWAAGALSAVFLALVVLAIGRAGVATSVNVLFRVAIVAIAVSAGWLYIQRLERQEQATELRLFTSARQLYWRARSHRDPHCPALTNLPVKPSRPRAKKQCSPARRPLRLR